MLQPTVAILMCVHAAADVSDFDFALASIKNQTYSDIRVFVYCDGPLMPGHECVMAMHLNVNEGCDKIIRCARSAGLPTGLNKLIECVLDDPSLHYLARMDADDVSLPDRIERQIDFMHRHPDVSVVGTWCVEFTNYGVPLFNKKLPIDHDEMLKFMVFRSPLVHPSVVFRRGLFEEGHRYNVNLTMMQDYELWTRLVIAGKRLANVPEFLLWYRMTDSFFSRRTGWRRACTEVQMRINFARQMGLLRTRNYFKYAIFILLRIAPVWIRRLAYKHLRHPR